MTVYERINKVQSLLQDILTVTVSYALRFPALSMRKDEQEKCMNTLPSRKDITIAAISILLTLLLNNLIITAGTTIYATSDGSISTPTRTEEPLSQELPAAPARTGVEPRSASVSVGMYTSLALTSSNLPVISYYDLTNYDLKLAVCNDAACTSRTISTLDSAGTVGGWTSIALTSSDTPVISYYDETNYELKLAVCNDANCTTPSVSTLDSTGDVGKYTSLAVTSSNLPVISYYDETNQDLKLAVCNDATCTSPTISTLESAGAVGVYTSIALTSSDVPVISYYDETNKDLKLAVCNNTACTIPTISTLDTGYVGTYTSIAVTSSNLPVISYHDGTNSDLKLAVCTNTACTSPTISTLDSTGYVGYFTSIAVTSSNLPVISYYNLLPDYDLKLAVCNNANCTSPAISTLESTGNVGMYNSIALTSSNIPVVSYYDAINRNLKLYHAPVTVDEGKPNSFAKSTPANNATITSTSTTLTWGAISNATSYEYCVATSTDTCTTWTSTLTSTTATKTELVHNTTYYWQVRAINAAGTTYADSMSFGQFTVVLAPAAFNKTSPANNATNQPATVTLTWAASTRATSYEYCIATSTAACPTWTSTGTSMTATHTSLVHNTTYYWQVRAINAAGTTNADSVSFGQFTVVLPPAAFSMTTPANNAVNQPTTVTLTWAASTRATSYEYCVALTQAACTNWKSTGTKTTVAVSGLAKAKSYFWQVRAKNTGGITISSGGYRKFTTQK